MKIILGLLLLFAVRANAVQGNSCVVTYQADFGATTVSTRALLSSPYRKCLVFQNNGASTVYIKFTSAHTGTENYLLTTGATWQPIIIPTNAVYIKSAAGTVNVTILDGK